MSRARFQSSPPSHRRDVLAIVASLVMAFLSLTKAWLFFLTGPALLIAIPLLFGVRSRAERLRVLGRLSLGTSRLAAAVQIGLFVAYACVPGFGDTSNALLFAFWWVDLKSPLVTAMWYLSIAGAVVAIVSSIKFNGVWRRLSSA